MLLRFVIGVFLFSSYVLHRYLRSSEASGRLFFEPRVQYTLFSTSYVYIYASSHFVLKFMRSISSHLVGCSAAPAHLSNSAGVHVRLDQGCRESVSGFGFVSCLLSTLGFRTEGGIACILVHGVPLEICKLNLKANLIFPLRVR